MKKIVLIITIFVFLQAFANEADSLKTKNKVKYHLEGVSVVAEKPTQAIGKVTTVTISEDEVESKLSMDDVVEDVSGLNISRGGKSSSELSIRGFEKEDVTIMIDGRPIGGGYFDAVDLSSLPTGEIKEVQVIKGPVSALYGSNTMGGVVNIVTRQPKNSSWLKAGLQWERNNTTRLKLSSSHRFSDWDYFISMMRYQTDGFVLSDDFEPDGLEEGGVRDHSGREQYDMQTRLNWDFMDFHKIGISASYTWMDYRDIPVSTDEIYNPTYPDAIFRRFVDWKRYQFSALGAFQLTWNQKLNVNLYYDGYDDIYHTYKQPDYTDLSLNSRLLSTNIGLISKYTYEAETFDLVAGYRGERQRFNRKDNGSYEDWTSNWQFLQNPFVQIETDVSDVTVSAGCGFSTFYQNGRSDWIYHVEPSLGLNYETENFGNYNLAMSNNVNYPSLHELFSASSGNPDLKEESAWKYEFSTLHQIPRGSFEFSVYYNQIENMVDKVQQDNYELVFTNFEQVNSYGMEAALNWKYFTEHKLEYRYLDYTEDSDRPLNENPRNIVKLSERLTLMDNLKLDYKVSWNDNCTSEGHTLPSYWLHDVFVNYSFTGYKLKLGVENIFDLDYQDKYGYPQPGINFLISVEAEVF